MATHCHRQRPGTAAWGGTSFLKGKFYVLGGGSSCSGSSTNSFAYNPTTDQWDTGIASMTTSRALHSAAASSTRLYVFGGLADCANGTSALGGLEEYDPDNNTWSPITATGTPPVRYASPLVWTGTNLFVYGGSNNTIAFMNTGGRLDPNGPTWFDASCALPSCERANGMAFVWNNVVHRWGGNGGNSPPPLQYDLITKAWTAGTLPANTGTKVGVENRYADDGRRVYVLNPAAAGCPATLEVAIFDKQTWQWLPSDTASGPGNNLGAGAYVAWSGSELIAWSGAGACGGAGLINGGGKYQPPAP